MPSLFAFKESTDKPIAAKVDCYEYAKKRSVRMQNNVAENVAENVDMDDELLADFTNSILIV